VLRLCQRLSTRPTPEIKVFQKSRLRRPLAGERIQQQLSHEDRDPKSDVVHFNSLYGHGNDVVVIYGQLGKDLPIFGLSRLLGTVNIFPASGFFRFAHVASSLIKLSQA
jgi:hypothetical protein